MRFRLSIIIALVAVGFLPAGFSFAQTSTTSPTTEAIIKQLQALVISLQSQILELKLQLEHTNKEVAESRKEITEVKNELKITRSLERGARGEEVKELQQYLSQFPEIYPEGLITGYFGPVTEAAVKKLQEKHRIEAIGIVGPKTLAKINELIAKGAGESGGIPPGLLSAPGIQKKLGTTSSEAAHLLPPGTVSAIPAEPRGHTSTTTIPAIPAQAAVFATTTIVATSSVPVPPGTAPSPTFIPSPSPSPSPTATSTTALPSPSPSPALTTPPPAPPPPSSYPYGSALNLSNVSDVFGKIWGPGSNGIILGGGGGGGGGLNYSTQVGVGWSQQYGGLFVTSYSMQGIQSHYLTQTSPVVVTVTGPAGSIIEVWDLESLVVIATNKTNPGSPTPFTAEANHRYGGFGWYADNSQKDIAIYAAYSSSSPPPPPPSSTTTSPSPSSSSSATPLAPQMTITANVSNVTLSWIDVANETSYKVMRRKAGDTSYSTLATLAANSTSYQDPLTTYFPSGTTVLREITYEYAVQACATDCSADTNRQSILVYSPKPVSNVSLQQPSNDTVTINWTNNSAIATSLEVNRTTGGSSTGSYTTVATLGPNVTSYTELGLAPGYTYTYYIGVCSTKYTWTGSFCVSGSSVSATVAPSSTTASTTSRQITRESLLASLAILLETLQQVLEKFRDR